MHLLKIKHVPMHFTELSELEPQCMLRYIRDMKFKSVT